MGRPKAVVEGWLVGSVEALADCDAVVVVLGAAADEARALLVGHDVTIVVNADWEEGIGSSLRLGLSHVAHGDATRCLLSLVDLPDVGADVVRRLLAQPDEPEVLVRAVYDGRPGHPVLLGRDHWAGVMQSVSGDEGARAYLEAHEVVEVECGDLATGVDVDEPQRDTVTPTAGQPHGRTLRYMLGDNTGDTDSPRAVAAALERTRYLPDDALATVVHLAQGMQRPLLLEGEPGTGKTALAEALAQIADVPLIRLQCYEGIDASQALYDWDFPRQILHLRTLEALTGSGELDAEEAEKSLFDERFLLARPVLQALRQSPAVLLVDEVDRANDEFEAFLLEVLSGWTVSIPERGRSPR